VADEEQAPIGAAAGAVLVTVGALYLHRHPWLDPDQASCIYFDDGDITAIA
jgi:hypothetical protein